MAPIQIVSIVTSVAIFGIVVAMIRNGLLKERYALLWLCAAATTFVLSVWRDLLDKIALAMGVYYPPAFLFLFAFGWVLLMMLHFASVISGLSDRIKKLSQEVGILRDEIQRRD